MSVLCTAKVCWESAGVSLLLTAHFERLNGLLYVRFNTILSDTISLVLLVEYFIGLHIIKRFTTATMQKKSEYINTLTQYIPAIW